MQVTHVTEKRRDERQRLKEQTDGHEIKFFHKIKYE